MTANMPTCVVNAKFHPMLSDVTRETAAQGETVQQIVDRLGRKNGVNQWYCKKVYVEINGIPLLPAAYDRTVVKSTDQLVIQYNIPEGGDGKNPLKTILMLVVAVVATITQQHYITAGMYGAAFGVAVAAAGAMYAINALIPPEGLSNTGLGHADADKTSVYSITGMRNYTPHYKALPLVLGRVRYAPPYGALPYTINRGNDQYLYVDFVHGHGPLLIEEPRLGETALDQFEGVTVASRQGYVTDTPLKLMPNDVYPDPFGAEVVNGSPVIRTTQIDTEQSIVELAFVQGLFKINAETGERESATVKLVVWTSPTGENNWSIQEIKTITNQAAYPLRTSVTINHSPAGQYDIKVDRETLETNDKTYDTVTFAELKSIKFTDPVTFPVPIAETQLIIKGTDQLNGIIDNYNCWHTSICMDYEHTTGLWVRRPTNNPASLYRHVLSSNCTSRPVPLSRIDLDALEEWHDFCRTKGFTYNRVHDTSEPVPQIIRKICAAGRAMLVNPDGNWSVIIERARTLGPVQMFTPANSRKLSSKKTFSDVLHGYRITFNNEESDNQEDEIIAYAYGYDQTNSHIFEALQFPGVTKADQVKELAKYHHATRRYRSELFSWEADWEHLACSRGDMVSVAHDCILVSQATGRIKSIDVPTRTIVLDQAITVQSQTNYGLRIRTTPEGTEYSEIFTQLVYAQFPNWTTDTLTYAGSLPATVRKGDVYSFGEIGKEAIEVILTSKRPGKDMTATLTGVQYSWPEIELYLAGEYPTLNSGVSSPVFTSNQTPPPPTIEYISTGASSATTNPDGSTLQRITVVLSVPPGYRTAVDHFEGEIKTADGWVRSASNQNPIIFNNVAPGDHDLRFRSVSALGVTSAWVYRTVTQIVGTPPPEPIVSLSVTGKLFQNDLEWVLPADYRSTYRIEIYCSAGVNNRLNAKRVALLSGGTVWAHTGLSQKVEYYYWIRVVDNSNPPIYSEWYPLAIFDGIAASPITDPELVLDMLGESITKGQLAAELTAEIEDSGEKFSYLEQFLGNTYTVKIQENGDNPYVVGMGMVIYENWVEGDTILAGEYRWMDSRDNVYKALSDHTSSISNQPPLPPWELIPYGAKSSFAIVADQFSVSLPDGNGRVKPFITGIDGLLGIDGNLVVAGTIYSIALSTNDAYVITLRSANYVSGVSGYLFDSINGLVEINDFDILINYNSQISNKPTTLAEISVTEAEKLASIEAMATVGATWGSNVAGQPADEEIMNDVLALSIAQSYVDQTTYQAKITEIEGLLDGSISTWFYDYAPTLTNLPASDWTTTSLKDIHLGDLFYYQSGGTSHRFSKISGVYQWVTVFDSGVSEALAIANAAQDTADSKRRVFVVQPVPPYDIGDLWDAGGTPRITKRCSVNKAAGTAYAAGDWLVLANAVTSTDQIIDGAGLGTTATWTGVSGIPNDFVAQGNLITPYDDWVPGTSGAQGSFNIAGLAGTAAENRVVVGVGPLGGAEELWECLPDSGAGADGGWINDAVKVDPTKTYIWGCYFWKKDDEGTAYLGCEPVESLAGVLNSNPYFWSGDFPIAAHWYLVLGVVHPSGYTGVASGLAGVYDVTTGVKVISGREFRFVAGTTTQRHRAYHYNNTAGNGITVYQRMARPFVFPASKFPSVSSLTTKLGGIAPSADVTGANTSYDTARVGGAAAATIRDNSLAAITATEAMEADSKFSIAEKRTWQIQWPGMSANYDAVRSAALLVDVSVAALDTAKTTLYNFLNTTHAVFAASPTNTTLTQGDLKTKVAAFYTAMSNVISDTSAASLANTSNLCENSQFYDFPKGWVYGINVAGSTPCTYGVNLSGGWQLIGGNTVYALQSDGNSAGSTYIISSQGIPAQPGKKYGLSVYTGAHRCDVAVYLVFYNSAGVTIGTTPFDYNRSEAAGGTTLAVYKRLTSSGVSPVGTATIRPAFMKYGTYVGQTSSYLFATRVMLTEFSPGQTLFPAWSPTANERADKTGDAVDAGIDTTTGGLIVRDASTGDYAHLYAGDLNFYYQQSGVTHLYQSVNRLESGTATDGQVVTLPGIWKKKPRITLSPNALQTFSPALGTAQSQSLTMSAYNVLETAAGSRVYKFTAGATLSTTPTNYAFTHASLTSLDTGDTAAAATASGINSVSTIQPNAGAVSLSSAPMTCVTYCGNNTHWLLARIQINFVCAGVTTLVYDQLSTPKWHQDNQTITTTVPAMSTAITAPGGAILRYGYFTLSVQALGNQDYDGYGYWEAVTGTGHYFRATVTVPSFKTEYTMPGGSSVAAGRMNYLAIGE